MARQFEQITPEMAAWIDEQRIFFVATAPRAEEGLINCSPKGMDTFRVLAPREVAYLDLTGSGIETIAHLRENGRIVLLFCAFAGPPKIVRLHGVGEALTPGTPEFARLRPQFPDYPGVRAILRVALTRISDSCGFAVPCYDYVGERDTLTRWSEAKTEAGLARYRDETNARSLDGLPGLAPKSGP